MITSRVPLVLLPFLTLTLWACSQTPQFIARDEPWRADEERACLAAGVVRESPFVELRANLGGPACAARIKPFSVCRRGQGLGCSCAPRPAALPDGAGGRPLGRARGHPGGAHHFAQPAGRALKIAASYSCRPMNNVDGALPSEHGHANAIDISAFVLADGRDGRRSRPAGGAPSPSATSCATCIAALQRLHAPCSVPATTSTTATTSISTSPATAATARIRSASSARCPWSALRPGEHVCRCATGARVHPRNQHPPGA